MSKIRITTKREYIVEWDDGRRIELSCGDMVRIYLINGNCLEGIIGLPARTEPFTLGIRTEVGFITIRWTLIERITIVGYKEDNSLYYYSSWKELGYDE